MRNFAAFIALLVMGNDGVDCSIQSGGTIVFQKT